MRNCGKTWMRIFCKRFHGKSILGWLGLSSAPKRAPGQGESGHKNPIYSVHWVKCPGTGCIYLEKGVHFSNLYKSTVRASDKLMDNIVSRLVTQCLSWSKYEDLCSYFAHFPDYSGSPGSRDFGNSRRELLETVFLISSEACYCVCKLL